MRRIQVLFACLLCWTANTVNAAKVEINVVTEEAFPLQFIVNNQVTGPATDLVSQVLADSNISYKISAMPWARAYKRALSQPNTLIYSIARTPEREELFHWIGSISEIEYYLYGLKSKKIDKTGSTLKQLRVATIRQSATHTALENDGFENLMPLSQPEQSFGMLIKGRVDLITANKATFELACLAQVVDCQQIEPIAPIKQMKTSLYFALSKKSSPEVVESLKVSYKSLINKDEIQLVDLR